MTIENTLEKYWAFLHSIGGLTLPKDLIPQKMIDMNRSSSYDSIGCWKPITSTISDAEIAELEAFYGYSLPQSFKEFLKFKFYLDLELGILSWRLVDLLPTTRLLYWKKRLEEYISLFKNNGLIVIAESEQLNLLCFNCSKETAELYDYEVVVYTVAEEKYQSIARNFDGFFAGINVWLDDWIKNSKY